MHRNRNPLRVYRITANLNRINAENLVDSLLSIGILNLHTRAGRHPVLREYQSPFGIIQTTTLQGEPGETITFLATDKTAKDALDYVIEQGELNIPGHGSVFAEEYYLVSAHTSCRPTKFSPQKIKIKFPLHNNMAMVHSIVPRGHANSLARTALESGSAVPAIHYVHGTGIRDKLGLLRITIPSEKELLKMPVTIHDVKFLWDILLSAGRFDLPARGFLYETRIQYGLADLQVMRGPQHHLASLDQVISAMDHLQGDTQWRRRKRSDRQIPDKPDHSHNLTEIFIMLNEGNADTLVNTALDSGATGATISLWRHSSLVTYQPGNLPPARESVTLVVQNHVANNVITAIQAYCNSERETMAEIMFRPVQRAHTYVHK